VITTSARIGAAAFALGLCLAGPHGVAAADDAGGDPAADSTTAAANEDAAPRGVPSQSRRVAATAGTRDDRSGQSPEPQAQRVGTDRGRAPADPGPARRAAAVPAASAARGTPIAESRAGAWADGDLASVGVLTVATGDGSEPAAAPADTCPSCRSVAAQASVPVAGQAVTAVVEAARFIDRLGDWLASMPAGPVTDLLSGVLLLVRRTLFPTVPAIPVVSVGDAVADETSGQVVFRVELGRAYLTPVTVGYATDSSLTDPAAELADIAARATEGVDYQPVSGIVTFAPGQTSQQVAVTVLNDRATETPETFSLEIFATWSPAPSAAASAANATEASSTEVTSVVLASGTATIVDDDRVKIDVNPNFAYGDALLAAIFSDLAYYHRDDADFSNRVQATGWQGIGISGPSLGAGGYAPTAGGYGVRDGWSIQSYAFAGKRTAADGTEQFVVAFEGSNLPWEEPADWVVNASQFGWSRYYASLEPLMAEVVGQMLEAQNNQQKTQLIITGHSLGGAAAMMAFADLLAPQGNLWPSTADVLPAGRRVLDAVGGWSPETRTGLLAATSVYTFGAPSILIEPTKPGTAEATAFAALAAGSGFLAALGLLPAVIGALTVDDRKLPDFSGLAGITFPTNVFQFEHANTSWLPPYPGDIVAQIGSRDPGTVLQINLDNDVQDAYTSLLTRFIPGGTHPMEGYEESVTRLVTNSRLLKSPNKLSETSPKLTQTSPGQGSDVRNDFFVNVSDNGAKGNDLFAFSAAGSYSANGAEGSDAYSINGYGISLLIDGSVQSGRDTVVFNLAGTPGATYYSSGPARSNDVAVFSVTGAGGQSSSVTITSWDTWQVSDVFQVIKPADGQWSIDVWPDIERGPVVAASPANAVPLSVL